MNSPQVALVTGGARRIGAAIVRALHEAGFRLAIHCRGSRAEAEALAAALNAQRADSAAVFEADLQQLESLTQLAEAAYRRWGRLDVLVNNASTYFQTPLDSLSPAQFEDLIGSNLRAPLFLTQACARRMQGGSVVNIVDALAGHAQRGFSAYLAAKSGLIALTRALALELAPAIRVNAVGPGHILWPETVHYDAARQQAEIARVPLARLGAPEDIARMVRYLVSPEASYLTGVVVPVDGGLSLG